MKKAKIRFPSEPTVRKCWLGSYGGHFSVVVVFNKKPVKQGGEYDLYANSVAGTFDQDTFNEWFGTEIEADDTRILEVEEYEIEAIWDKHGHIVGLNTRYDR